MLNHICGTVSDSLAGGSANVESHFPASAYARDEADQKNAAAKNKDHFQDPLKGPELLLQLLVNASSALNAYISTYQRTVKGRLKR